MRRFLALLIVFLWFFQAKAQQTPSVYYHNSGITYNIGDLVSVNGIIYRATAVNTGDTPPSANWVQATESGGGGTIGGTIGDNQVAFGNGTDVIEGVPEMVYDKILHVFTLEEEIVLEHGFWDDSEYVGLTFEDDANNVISYIRHTNDISGGALRIRNQSSTEPDIEIVTTSGDLSVGATVGNVDVSIPLTGGSFTVGSIVGPVISIDTTRVDFPRVSIAEINSGNNRTATTVEWVQDYVANNAPAPVEPANQIVYGTGSGIDSEAEFAYDSAADSLSVVKIRTDTISVDGNLNLGWSGVQEDSYTGVIFKNGFNFLGTSRNNITYPNFWAGLYAGGDWSAHNDGGQGVTNDGANVGVGTFAMSSLVSEHQSVGVGAGALAYTTASSDNTAVGANAMFFLDGGSANTGVGRSVFQPLQTGSNNVGLGKNAGWKAGAADVTSVNQGIYIGADVDASAATGVTNEAVIGYNATGEGSNTMRFGNASVTGYRVATAYTPTVNHDLATKKYVDDEIAGSGGGTVGGTGVDNQVAVWAGTNTIEGTTGLTWDGSQLNIGTQGGFQAAEADNLYAREILAFDAGGYGTANVQVQGATGGDRLQMVWNTGQNYFEIKTTNYRTELEGRFLLTSTIAEITADASDSVLVHKGYVHDYVANNAGGGPDGIYTFSATTPYTTVSAQNGYHVVLSGTATTITLDDAGVALDEQFTFYNKTGGNVTWAFGTGDSAYQGIPADIPDGEYAWATLEAANTWSVQVGGGAGGVDESANYNWTGTHTFETPYTLFGTTAIPTAGLSFYYTGASGQNNIAWSNGIIDFIQNGTTKLTLGSEVKTTLDPTTGDGIGNRDYNDARYATTGGTNVWTGANTFGTVTQTIHSTTFSGGSTPTADFNGTTVRETVYANSNQSVTGTISETKVGTVVFCTQSSSATFTIPDTWTQKSGAHITFINIEDTPVTINVSGTATLNGGANSIVIPAADASGNSGVTLIQQVNESDDWYSIGKF